MQLEKHELELKSLLGNLLLRLSSKRLQDRIRDYPLNHHDILLSESGQSSAAQAMRAVLNELSPRVDQRLETYELSDALEEIVNALSLVCITQSIILLSTTYRLHRSHNATPTQLCSHEHALCTGNEGNKPYQGALLRVSNKLQRRPIDKGNPSRGKSSFIFCAVLR